MNITQQQRQDLTLAVVAGEHQIDADCIRLHRDPTQEGSALSQLVDRVAAVVAQSAQPALRIAPDETVKDAEVIRLIEESGALLAAYEPRVWLVNLKDVRALLAEAERLAAQAARDDAALYQTIGERDNYHKWADKLADGIATHLGIDIGEHTAGMGSAESNNPWANALEAIQSADPPACPNCRGSGCVQQMTGHLGPDDYEETVDCPHCNGNQTLGAAYEGVLKSLRDEREAHTRTRSIIWGWTSSRSEVNAVQHKLGNILEHLKPGNIAWVGDRLRDLIASAAAQPSQAPVVQAVPENCGTGHCSCIECVVDADRASSGATTQAVRMLTRDELNDVALSEQVGWGPGEYVEAIQRKFCEVNKLPAPADGVIAAKSPLICPWCKVDRLKDDCPGPRDSCPIKFDAQSGGAA